MQNLGEIKMKYKLFGANIQPDCNICDNFRRDSNNLGCVKNRTIKNGKCRKFDYNPILRTPKSEAKMMQFKKEDFEL